MKLRWKILIGLGIFLLLAALSAWFTASQQPESELSVYLDSLRARGEKLEITDIVPPHVPAESNCVDAVRMAFGSLGAAGMMMPTPMRMVAPGKAMAAWQQPDVRGWNGGSGYSTNSWDDVETNVATFRPALDGLRAVFDRFKLDFHIDYKKGISTVLPDLAQLKRSAQALETAAILDLHEGDTGEAVTNTGTLLALVHADQDEPTLISHLVRIAITAIAEYPTWELLQSTNATEEQLAFLQKNWEQLEFIDTTRRAFEMERAIEKDGFEKGRSDGAEFDRLFGGMISGGIPSTAIGWPPDLRGMQYQVGKAVWRVSWSYTEEMQAMQADQAALETLRGMETNADFLKPQIDAMRTKISLLGLTNAGAAFFHALKIPDFDEGYGGVGAIMSKNISIEAARRVVVAAIALKRHQLKYGAWPQTLVELSPEFLVSVPIDPYDGKPLRYHPNADGTYLLYCVAINGVDDGGDPTGGSGGRILWWNHPKARDWVWPQPATAAEIQFFKDHPPK